METGGKQVATNGRSIRITHNSMCLAVMGSERKSEADSENLVADSVVKYLHVPLLVFCENSGWRCR